MPAKKPSAKIMKVSIKMPTKKWGKKC
jgi:hypothetical protein